jgi:hypothetical protein
MTKLLESALPHARLAGGLMSDRLDFETVCPNNHNQTVTFSKKEFEVVLKSGSLMFHCNTCDTDWPPSKADIVKLQKELSKDQG